MNGNNIQAVQIVNIQVALFDEYSNTMQPGQKYFFPEHPEIDKKTVVGIEVHASGKTVPSGIGDINDSKTNIINVRRLLQTYVTIYNNKNESVFENIPSLFLYNKFVSNPSDKYKLSIQPFYGKIRTRNCYIQIPANTVSSIVSSYYSITFYLR